MSSEPLYGAGEHLTPDQCVDLVNGLVDLESRHVALSHASACSGCGERLREAASSHQRGVARMDEWLSRPSATPGTVSFPQRRVAWFAAAAAFLVVAIPAVMRLAVRPQPLHLETRWLPISDRSDPIRDWTSTRTDSTVAEGIEAYSRRDLARAIELLGSVRATGSMEKTRVIYLASSLVATGRFAEAAPILESLDPAVFPDPWSGEVMWMLAQSYAATGATARADSILRDLAIRPDSVAARARAALQRSR